MTSQNAAAEETRDVPSFDEDRWGPAAPAAVRVVLGLSWLALVLRGLAAALPGARTGIEQWIGRAEVLSSLSSQLAVLLGCCLLVLLVVYTLSDRELGTVYRIFVVPSSAAVLMLVLLALKFGLEPALCLALGASCIALASSGASSALRFPSSRATGLVLALLSLSAAFRLALRLLSASDATRASATLTAFLGTGGSVLDVLAVSLAGARFIAEGRTRATFAFGGVLVGAGILSWGALQGSLDGASLWEVLAANGLSEMSLASIASPGGGRAAVDAIAILLSFAVVAWPGRVSSKLVAIAFALLSRPGVDVPASALVLCIGALVAPLGPFIGEMTEPASVSPPPPHPREAGG